MVRFLSLDGPDSAPTPPGFVSDGSAASMRELYARRQWARGSKVDSCGRVCGILLMVTGGMLVYGTANDDSELYGTVDEGDTMYSMMRLYSMDNATTRRPLFEYTPENGMQWLIGLILFVLGALSCRFRRVAAIAAGRRVKATAVAATFEAETELAEPTAAMAEAGGERRVQLPPCRYLYTPYEANDPRHRIARSIYMTVSVSSNVLLHAIRVAGDLGAVTAYLLDADQPDASTAPSNAWRVAAEATLPPHWTRFATLRFSPPPLIKPERPARLVVHVAPPEAAVPPTSGVTPDGGCERADAAAERDAQPRGGSVSSAAPLLILKGNQRVADGVVRVVPGNIFLGARPFFAEPPEARERPFKMGCVLAGGMHYSVVGQGQCA